MKKFLTIIASLVFCFGANAQTTTTNGFESATDLSNNFTYTCQNANGSMTIATDKKHSGNSSLKATMGGTGQRSNFLITTSSFTNVTSLSFWYATSDKGKTSMTIEYSSVADFSSDVHSVMAATTCDNMPGWGGSNNTFYQATYTTSFSGYIRFTFTQPSSSGKYIWMDDLEIVSGGTPGPVVSHDATLSALAVNGQTLVPAFSSATETYSCTLPFGTTTVPTVTYTTTDANATAVKTDATSVTGTTTIVVTAEDGTTTKTYTIQFSVAPDPSQPSNDATLSALAVAGNTLVPAFNPLTTSYTVELPYGTTTVPTVTYTTNDTKASAVKTDAASTTGTTTIVVTAEDGTTTKTYSITFSVAQPGPPVPPTTLTLHEPGVYEEIPADGGYGAALTPFGGNNYEVFYMNRLKSGDLTFTTEGTDQSAKVVTTGINATELRATDGWFHMLGAGPGGQSGSIDEFTGYTRRADIKGDNGILELRIKGYKEFALLGTDKKKGSTFGDANCKYLQVNINGENQVTTLDQIVTSYTVRRYPLNPLAEYVIKVTGVGNDATRICGFSLAVGRTPNPRIKWTTGDSIQTVYTGLAIKDVEYFAKYSNGNCKFKCDIPGLTLYSFHDNTANGDSLRVSGNAAGVPAGDYPYLIYAIRDGDTVSVANGMIHVRNHIWAKSDTVSIGYTGEGIDEFIFGFYADPADVSYQGNLPAGVTGQVVGSNYVISGTPTATGTFNFTVSVAGGETIQCTLTIQTGGNFDILYLYKEIYPTNLTVDDGFYLYLQTLGAGYTVAARKAQASGLRADYSKYRMIIIAESADANNAEVIAVAQGQAGKPVLNMKAFTYGPHADRLKWGTPDVGTIATADITVTATHAIFTALGWANGSTHTLFSQIKTRANMVVYDVTNGGTQLATGYTRDRVYTNSGQVATFMQEIPAANRGGQKYILLPMAYFSSPYMTQDAKNLLKRTIDYLLQ